MATKVFYVLSQDLNLNVVPETIYFGLDEKEAQRVFFNKIKEITAENEAAIEDDMKEGNTLWIADQFMVCIKQNELP